MKSTIAFNAFLLSSASTASTVSTSSPFRTLAQRTSTLTKNISRARTLTTTTPTLRRQLEDPCTPCAGGLEPTNLDGSISLPEDMVGEGLTTMTCQEGSVLAGLVSSDDESCPMFQLIGYAFCGCPTPPTIEGVEICSLCYDGTPVPNPELVVDVGAQLGPNLGEDGLTCGLAQLGLGFMNLLSDPLSDMDVTGGDEIITTLEDEVGTDPSADDICPMMQTSIGTLCGCPVNPEQPSGCSICPEGTALSNPTKVIEIEDMAVTCGAGAVMASSVPSDDDQCNVIQADAQAVGCECEEDDDSAGFATTTNSGFIAVGTLAVATFIMSA